MKIAAPWVAALVAALTALAVLVLARRLGVRELFGEGEDTIFVSIASYRDEDCANTLRDLFAKASKPARIFVGVCEQNTAAGSEACFGPGFEWHDNVRRIGISHKEAKGPTYARYLCSTLYRGETFFCQLDSHMRFVPGWDEATVAMWRACPSPKAVVTYYPHDTKLFGRQALGIPTICKANFTSHGLLAFEAATLPPSTRPRPVPFTAGGFLFGPGRLLEEVPFDPDLPHLFQGEELLYSARLWTSGYDFFAPTANVVFHKYYRRDSAKFWQDLDYEAELKRTVAKVRALLAGRLADYAYGMGAERTLRQYWEFAGVDWSGRTVGTAFCSP